MKKTRFNAFTMAEILLSLTIIGVVAAITLPSLMGNINERTWNTQRKALHARMSQAIAMMPQLNGYGTFVADTVSAGSVTSSGTDTAAEAFLTDGLSKVIKINNICDYEHIEDCGIPKVFYNMGGSTITTSGILTTQAYNPLATSANGQKKNTKPAAFETQNGESILVYYNPDCDSKIDTTSTYSFIPKVCANFLFDLNGNKGPNTAGKDIGFVTALYATDPVIVAPKPTGGISEGADAGKDLQAIISVCTSSDPESRGPNLEENFSIIYNKVLLPKQPANDILTTTQTFIGGDKYTKIISNNSTNVSSQVTDGVTGSLFCVKR